MNATRRPFRLLMAAALGCGLALLPASAFARRGTAPTARAPEASRALAVMNQDTLPALAARRDAANARQQALDVWFAGDHTSVDAVLPELAGRPLLDPTAIWGAIRDLDARAAARATERITPTPVDLHPSDAERLSQARTATLDAEDAADVRIRRFWSGLLAATERAEGLQVQAVRNRLATLSARSPASTPDGPDGPSDEAAAAALARAKAEGALLRLQAAAVRAAIIPGDTTLDTLVQRDVETLQTWLKGTTAPAGPRGAGRSGLG